MKRITAYQSDDGQSASLHLDEVAAYERNQRVREIAQEIYAHIQATHKPHEMVSLEDITVVLTAVAQLHAFKLARRLERIQRQFQRNLKTDSIPDEIPF